MIDIETCEICGIQDLAVTIRGCCYVHEKLVCRECLEKWADYRADDCRIPWKWRPWLSTAAIVAHLRHMEAELR